MAKIGRKVYFGSVDENGVIRNTKVVATFKVGNRSVKTTTTIDLDGASMESLLDFGAAHWVVKFQKWLPTNHKHNETIYDNKSVKWGTVAGDKEAEMVSRCEADPAYRAKMIAMLQDMDENDDE